MDIATIAGIIGTAVSVFAAYHLASRHWTFARGRYVLGVGPPQSGKHVEFPFAVLIPLPPIPADRFLLALPVSISHVSGPGLTDIRCRTLFPREYSREHLAEADARQLDEAQDEAYGETHTSIGDGASIDFTLPNLRPDEHAVMAATISVECWHSKKGGGLKEEPGEGTVTALPVAFGAFSPTHRAQRKTFKVLLVRTRQETLSTNDVAAIVHKAVLGDKKQRVLRTRVLLSRVLSLPIVSYRCLIMKPTFYRMSDSTAIEGMLCGGDPTVYEWVTTELHSRGNTDRERGS